MTLPSYAGIHLAVTHLPVVTAMLAATTLALAALRRSPALQRFGLALLLVAGLTTIPAFFTGEGAEEIVEDRPGVSEAVIERHEEAAEVALVLLLAGAASAASALLATRLRRSSAARALFFVALLLSLANTVALGWVAHLGGQIRHDEIRVGTAPVHATASRRGVSADD